MSKRSIVKAMVFPVVMYRCESWTRKKTECQRIDAFELWCSRRLLKISWTPKRSNQSIIKETSPKERREKERRGGRTGFAPLGSWGVERFLHPGKPTHWWGNQLGWKGSIWSYWRRMKQLICGGQKSETYRWSVPKPYTPKTWGCVCQFTVGAESLNMGIGDQTQEEDCHWLWGDSLRGWKGGNLQPGMLVEDIQTATEVRHHCWVTSHAGHEATIAAPLSLHDSPLTHQVLVKAPTMSGLLVLAARIYESLPLRPDLLHPWLLAFLLTYCHRGPHDSSSYATSASCPRQSRLLQGGLGSRLLWLGPVHRGG